jgi:hypothetical protein
MPKSVLTATIAMCWLLAFSVLGTLNSLPLSADKLIAELLRLFLGILILWGLARGHRLAWQWGRYLAFLAGIMATIAVVAGLRVDAASIVMAVVQFLVFPVPLIVIGVSLGRPSARTYFRLVCPTCSSYAVKAVDMMFNKARCKKCDITW